ncbi:MAG: LysR family transcriptional regulator [Archangium sp.]|nr:LysR family transcriptional regulator [Archangium sp.]
MIDLDLLPLYGLFALVLRAQSFSAAAKETGLTRSAVSQRIARLEARLGVELFRRTTRRVLPTAQGLALYEAASRLLDDTRGLQLLGPPKETPLRINAPLSLVTAALSELLPEFVKDSPGPIELTVESRPIDLLEAKDDVVVRVARQLPGGVVGRKLATDVIVAVASPGYLAKHGTPTTPHDLLRHRCLRYRPTPAEAEWRFTPPRGPPVTIPVSPPWIVDEGSVLQQLVRQGEGVGTMPSFMVKADLDAGVLVRVLPGFKLSSLELWALLPAGRRSPPRARALIELLARKLASRLPRVT